MGAYVIGDSIHLNVSIRAHKYPLMYPDLGNKLELNRKFLQTSAKTCSLFLKTANLLALILKHTYFYIVHFWSLGSQNYLLSKFFLHFSTSSPGVWHPLGRTHSIPWHHRRSSIPKSFPARTLSADVHILHFRIHHLQNSHSANHSTHTTLFSYARFPKSHAHPT